MGKRLVKANKRQRVAETVDPEGDKFVVGGNVEFLRRGQVSSKGTGFAGVAGIVFWTEQANTILNSKIRFPGNAWVAQTARIQAPTAL